MHNWILSKEFRTREVVQKQDEENAMCVAACVCDTVKDTRRKHLPSPHRGAPVRYVCVCTCECA
jgi:hypothetical protein